MLCFTSPTMNILGLFSSFWEIMEQMTSCTEFESWYSSIIISLNIFLYSLAASEGAPFSVSMAKAPLSRSEKSITCDLIFISEYFFSNFRTNSTKIETSFNEWDMCFILSVLFPLKYSFFNLSMDFFASSLNFFARFAISSSHPLSFAGNRPNSNEIISFGLRARFPRSSSSSMSRGIYFWGPFSSLHASRESCREFWAKLIFDFISSSISFSHFDENSSSSVDMR